MHDPRALLLSGDLALKGVGSTELQIDAHYIKAVT